MSAIVSGVLAVAVMAAVTLGVSQTAVAAPSPSQQWMTSAAPPQLTGPGQTVNIGFGTTGVTATSETVAATGAIPPECWLQHLGGPLTNLSPTVAPFIEPDPPADASALGQCVPAGPGGSQTSVVTFNKPVIGPILHVVNLDGSYLDIGGTMTSGAPITVTPLVRNTELTITGNRLNSDQNPAVVGGCDLDDGATDNGSCGSIQMGPGSPLVQAFSMNNVGVADSWQWSLSFPTAPLTKQFSPNRIPVGGQSTLTFTINNPANPGQVTLTPLDFTDVLPAGVTLANGTVSNNGSCGANPSVADSGGGALAAGDTGVSASNISVAVGATCTITVNVTSSTATAPNTPHVNDNTNLSTTVANLIPNASTTLEVYPVADPQIVKTASPSPAVPGEDLTFRLAVRNNGPQAATDVVATDNLPDTVQFKSASQSCAEAGGTVTCSVASLAAGATHTFEIVVAVPSSATECIANTAAVTNSTVDSNLANNNSTICVPVKGSSGVSFSKTASSARVAPGGQVMYTLVVENNGPSDDPGVNISDPLPAGMTLVAAEASQGSCTTANNTVACDLGALKNGGSAQVLVTATAPQTGGCVTNTATAQGTNEDPDADDNQASATICVDPPPPGTFDLAVEKRTSATRVTVGQRVTYTIVVSNNGPDAAPEAKVTDTFNNRGTLVSVSTTAGTCVKAIPMTCSLGRIESGASVTITVVIKPRVSGKARNAASATSCCGNDRTPENNLDTADITVRKVALKLSKVASRSSVMAGDTLSYRIRVRNPSRVAARNVKVCDRLPSGLSFISSTPKAKGSGSQRCWTIKSLKAGQSRTFRVTVRTAKGANGRKVNRATLSGSGIKPATARDPIRVRGVATPITG